MRNLTPGEFAAQVTTACAIENTMHSRRHEVAYIGVGEPMYTIHGVLRANEILRRTYPAMNFKVSTPGVVLGIKPLAIEGLYLLFAGVNHSDEFAHELGDLLRGRPFVIQLVLANTDDRLPYRPATFADLRRFAAVLEGYGFAPHHAVQLGDDDNCGGCGQLDADHAAKGSRIRAGSLGQGSVADLLTVSA